MSEEQEDGVCVCCKAAADLMHDCVGDGDGIPVCRECKEDGTYKAWLSDQLEQFFTAKGWPFTICPKTGHKLYTPRP